MYTPINHNKNDSPKQTLFVDSFSFYYSVSSCAFLVLRTKNREIVPCSIVFEDVCDGSVCDTCVCVTCSLEALDTRFALVHLNWSNPSLDENRVFVRDTGSVDTVFCVVRRFHTFRLAWYRRSIIVHAMSHDNVPSRFDAFHCRNPCVGPHTSTVGSTDNGSGKEKNGLRFQMNSVEGGEVGHAGGTFTCFKFG